MAAAPSRTRLRRVLLAGAAAVALAIAGGADAAHAWRLTIDIYGSGTVEEIQRPNHDRQRCGSLQATTGEGVLQQHCVSPDYYCGLCNYRIVATPAPGFAFAGSSGSGRRTSPGRASPPATWAIGNAGDFEVRAFFEDNTPPDTGMSGGPPEGSFTNVASATFNLSTTRPFSAGSYVCTLNGTPIACGNPLALSSLPDGPKILQVQAKDPSNNVDPTPARRSWTVDTLRPVTTLSGGPVNGSRINSRSASFGVAVNEPVKSLVCTLNGVSVGCSPGSQLSLTNLADGTYTLSVRATDRADDQEQTPVTRTWTVDNDPPATGLSGGPPNGALVRDRTATFTITSDEPGPVTCTLDGAPRPCAQGAFTITELGDGDHTLTVRASDEAGNADPGLATRQWTVDATEPDTVIESGPAQGARLTDRTAVFSFAGAGEGGRYECRMDGGAFGPCSQSAAHRLVDLAQVFPGAPEVPGNGKDDDCKGDGDAPLLDTDGDTLFDHLDACPTLAGGPFDADLDGCPGPFGRISIATTATWSSVTRKGLKLIAVVVADAPKGSRVQVLCPGRKRCPYAQQRTSTGEPMRLKKFAGKVLAPGSRFAILVTQPGMIGDYIMRQVKRPGRGRAALKRFRKAPLRIVRRCVPEGTTAPQSECSAVVKP